METHEIEPGLSEAAGRWADSPVRQRICIVLKERPDLVAAVVSAETLAAMPWPWKLCFPLNAAVHLLVLEGRAPDLEPYLPSVGGGRPLDAGFDDALLTLVAAESERLRELTDRPLRTQDPRQTVAMHEFLQGCAGLFPTAREWSLISLGCAAGFELLLGDAEFCGGPARYPTPRDRVGVDLAPIDLGDEDARRWLRACADASSSAVPSLVEHARDRLGSVAHRLVRGDAAEALSSHQGTADVLVVSHQFLCSVDDPAAMADTISRSPRVRRWLSVEVPSTAALAYEVIEDHPPGTPLATLLDADLRVLQQGPLPTPA